MQLNGYFTMCENVTLIHDVAVNYLRLFVNQFYLLFVLGLVLFFVRSFINFTNKFLPLIVTRHGLV